MRRAPLRLISLLLLSGLVFGVLRTWWRGHPLEGEPAPEFTLPVIDARAEQGERVRLRDQRGKVVVLDFWASWCTPCRHSVSLLNRTAKRFGNRIAIFGINSEQIGLGRIAFAALNWGIQYPVLSDGSLEAQLAYQVEAFPTVVVIDRTGTVRKVYRGEPTEASLYAQISRYIE